MSLNLATLNLGDKFSFGKYAVSDETPWPIVWSVVHKADEYIACMPINILDQWNFDAAEPASANVDQRTAGNNDYSVSNIFIWLNSDAPGGQWYDTTARPHANDTVPEDMAAHPGFLYYFTDSEKGALKSFALTIAKNTVTAGGGSHTVTGKVHLPTAMQLCGTATNSVAEGVLFDAFKENTVESRKAYFHPQLLKYGRRNSHPSIVSQAWRYWMASANTGSANLARYIGDGGNFSGNGCTESQVGIRPVIYFPVTGIVTEAFEFGIQPSKTIEGKSKIYDLSKPDVSFRTVLSGNFEGATSIQVFATNNAYDASPKWEDVTQAYLNNAPYSFNNATKTASSWGMQLRVVVTKTNAPAVCLKGCAFEIL